MSKNTATKKTKKPRVFRSVDEVKKAYFPKKYAEDMKAWTADHDGLEKKLLLIQYHLDQQAEFLIAMRKELLPALESRSAPAEDKAKEEQRALEAEWKRFDVLQDGDYVQRTPAVTEVAKLLPQAGPCSLDRERCVWCSDAIGVKPPLIWGGTGFSATKNNELPEQEWIRRANGTIAKRAEDERAKEMDKPLEMGMKVRSKEYGEGFYWFLNDSPSDGFHRIILPKGNVATVLRDQFTIID